MSESSVQALPEFRHLGAVHWSGELVPGPEHPLVKNLFMILSLFWINLLGHILWVLETRCFTKNPQTLGIMSLILISQVLNLLPCNSLGPGPPLMNTLISTSSPAKGMKAWTKGFSRPLVRPFCRIIWLPIFGMDLSFTSSLLIGHEPNMWLFKEFCLVITSFLHWIVKEHYQAHTENQTMVAE